MRFLLGVNYWPGSSAMAMWRHFDLGEIRADFAHMAALGLDAVRFFVRWDDFAPAPHDADPAMLARLEAVVDAAGEAGLRALPVLFCGHVDGVNFLPAWALEGTASRRRSRTFVGTELSPYGVGDLYAGPLLDAQAAFARAVTARLGAHPALLAYDLGDRVSDVAAPPEGRVFAGAHTTAPVAEPEVAAWSKRLAAALRERAPVAVTAGTHADDLVEDRSLRLASLCVPFAFASMQGTNVRLAFARGRRDPAAVPFLASLAAAFSYKPVMVVRFGNPGCPAGKFSAFERFSVGDDAPLQTISPEDTVFATFPCLTDDENAAYARDVLERLHADGRLGAFWWSWSDYAAALRTEPPFDERPDAMTCGLVRTDGSEKPVARSFATFAAERREVLRERDVPAIASAYYYRTLPSSTRTLYEAYLRTVST